MYDHKNQDGRRCVPAVLNINNKIRYWPRISIFALFKPVICGIFPPTALKTLQPFRQVLLWRHIL